MKKLYFQKNINNLTWDRYNKSSYKASECLQQGMWNTNFTDFLCFEFYYYDF